MGLHLRSPLRSLSVESLKRQYQRSRRQVSELENQEHRLASGFAPREWRIGDTGPYWSRRDSRDYAADHLDAQSSCSSSGKRDRSDIDKLGGSADVRAIFTRARHFDFGPPFAGDPWDDRPTLGPNVARFPAAIPAGQRGGLVARSSEAIPVPARRRFD